MTREEAINVLNDYDINFERHTAEEIAEAHEMAIKAIRTIPSEDEKIIRIKKGTLKARTGRYVIYDVEWLKTHFNTTEAKIYGQPNEDCISRQAVLEITAETGALETQTRVKALPSVNPQLNTDILDKIRAEIEGIIQKETVVDNSGGEYESIVSKLDPDDVLQIIDKYKAGSEG